MNKKGQALVEFIIIVPILIMLILCLVDFGKIFYTKNALETAMDDIINIYEKDSNKGSCQAFLDKTVSDASLDIQAGGTETTFIVSKDVEVFTPGLNTIIKNPYKASVKRVVPNE